MTTSFRGKFPTPPSIRAAGRRAQTAGGSGAANLTFPSDLGAHFTLFQFHRYTFAARRQARRITEGAIALPPPLQMTEKHNVNYNNTELGVVAGAGMTFAGEAASKYLNQKGGGSGPQGNLNISAADMLEGVMEQAKERFGQFQNAKDADRLAAASAPFREGTGRLAAAGNLVFGNSPNPHITAVFRGVGLNEHSFNWNLSPRSSAESFLLADIIQEFKRAALPNFHDVAGASGALLTFPKVVSIVFLGHSNRKFLYEFKDSVIKSINVEYAPNGPSFFAGTGAPTHITLSLNIQEIQIHTAEDHPSTFTQNFNDTNDAAGFIS